jgi:hypothetical protein
MTLKSVTEGTQPKKVQSPSQLVIPQPRPVAEVHTSIMYIYISFFLIHSVVLLTHSSQITDASGKYIFSFYLHVGNWPLNLSK